MELLKKCPYLPLKQKWPTSTLPGHYFQVDLQKEVRQRGKGETNKGESLAPTGVKFGACLFHFKGTATHAGSPLPQVSRYLLYSHLICIPMKSARKWKNLTIGSTLGERVKSSGRYECLWAHFNQHKLLAIWKKALPPPLRPTLPILSYRGRFKSPPPTCSVVLSAMEHLKTRGRSENGRMGSSQSMSGRNSQHKWET